MATDSARGEYVDKTVQIKRCAAVVKGGRRFSFAALVVVGDGKGKVGWGYAKANEVPPAVEKAQKQASRSMVTVPLVGAETIPHYSRAKYGSADVMLQPADAGTGVIAGAAVRAVCEAVVRRTREYVDSAEAADLATRPKSAVNKAFGRRFEIVSFRWLNPSEI